MKKCTSTKRGISLIVLVITIIVMAILAGTVIITISNTNVINEASKTKIRSDLSSLQDMVGSYVASNYMTIDRRKEYKLSDYGIYNDEYENITYIRNGRLYVASSASSDIQEIARELNMLKGIISSDIGRIDINDAKLTNIIISGNSTQDGTPTPDSPIEIKSVGEKSKNLFDVNTTIESSQYSDIIVVEGTNITTKYNQYSSYKYLFNYINVNSSEQYTISYKVIQGAPRIGVCLYDTERNIINDSSIQVTNLMYNSFYKGYFSNNTTVTFTIPEEVKYIRVFLVAVSNTNKTDNIYSEVQLEEGTTATAYEPYGYKIPIEVKGNNLFSASLEIGGLSGLSGINFNSTTRIRFTDYIEIEPNTIYTYSFSSDYVLANSHTYDENYNRIGYFNKNSTTSSGARYAKISFKKPDNSELTDEDVEKLLSSLIIVKGTTIIDYAPYVEPITTNIYLDEPLRKIGDYADYIDFASGKVVRNIKEYAFTGNENWGLNWTNDTTTIYGVKLLLSDSKYNSDKTIIGINSNKLETVSYDGSGVTSIWNKRKDDNYKYLIAVDYCNNPCGTVYIKNMDYSSDETNFKKWLSDQYNSGDPVLVDYILSTPISQKISLPTTWSQSGTFCVTVMTSVKPSNLQVEYK